jgi:hypothetical protein
VTSTVLMIVGGLLWLAGELYGVYHRSQTTSGFVWSVEARWPLVRVLVGVFVASLFGHFLWHGALLP